MDFVGTAHRCRPRPASIEKIVVDEMAKWEPEGEPTAYTPLEPKAAPERPREKKPKAPPAKRKTTPEPISEVERQGTASRPLNPSKIEAEHQPLLRPDRRGKEQLGIWIDAVLFKKLKHAAVDRDMTVTDLVAKAIAVELSK